MTIPPSVSGANNAHRNWAKHFTGENDENHRIQRQRRQRNRIQRDAQRCRAKPFFATESSLLGTVTPERSKR